MTVGIANYSQVVIQSKGALINKLLTPHAYINLRRAQGIISIAEKYSSRISEKAAAKSLTRKNIPHPKEFKHIIQTIYSLENQDEQGVLFSQETESFIRNMDYFTNN